MLEYAHELKPPFTFGSHPTVRLPANYSTEIGLSRTFYDRIFNSKNSCTNEVPKCRLECSNEFVHQYCNCSLLGFSEDRDENSSFHICNPVDATKCYALMPFEIYYSEHCSDFQCPVPCKEWIYNAQVTTANLDRKMWEVYTGI